MHFLLFSGVNSDMPRTYQKVVGGWKTSTYDPKKLAEAVEANKSGRTSLRNAAEKNGVKKLTLYNHVKFKSIKRQGGQPILNEETKTKRLFVEQLITCVEWGYPLTAFYLRIIWKNFLICKELTRGYLKISRFLVYLGHERIKSYFSNLKSEIDNVLLSNIVNYDETNLTDDPKKM